MVLTTPWQIDTKIEEWPSRAKWVQAGPNGAKRGQMVKVYLNGFILSRYFKFLGAPFMVKNLY